MRTYKQHSLFKWYIIIVVWTYAIWKRLVLKFKFRQQKLPWSHRSLTNTQEDAAPGGCCTRWMLHPEDAAPIGCCTQTARAPALHSIQQQPVINAERGWAAHILTNGHWLIRPLRGTHNRRLVLADMAGNLFVFCFFVFSSIISIRIINMCVCLSMLL